MSAAARHAREGAAREGRPFFVAALAAALVAASACAAPSARAREPAGEPLVASGPAGARQIALFACESGAPRARATLPDALSAPVATDFGRGALYAATAGGELLRYALPELRLAARVPLGFAASALAAAGGPDSIVLAGGSGTQPLSAHDPDTLATLARYPAGEAGATVSAILTIAERRRFVVAFADLPELWEIAWPRDAPPVLRGLVHDYRMGEAVPLPGRLTPRPFGVPGATRALLAGPSPFELLRIDAGGGAGVVNLEVRREIERPPLPGLQPQRVAAWRAAQARGWLIRTADGQALVLAPPHWRAEPVPDGPDALAGAHERLRQLDALGAGAAQPTALVPGSGGGCEALLDRDGRWLGRLRAAR